MRIALTSIYVDDPVGKAFEFYTSVLRFVPRLVVPEASLVIVAAPDDPDGVGLLLEPNDNPVASTYQDALFELALPALVLGVEDVWAEYERMVALDVVFREEPVSSEQGTGATFEDTCGNLLQLFQPA